MTKRLLRSTSDRKLSGVLGGIAEYFEIDATLVRLLFIAVCIFSAVVPAVIAYIVAAIIVPEA